MPNLDALGGRGLVFDRLLATSLDPRITIAALTSDGGLWREAAAAGWEAVVVTDSASLPEVSAGVERIEVPAVALDDTAAGDDETNAARLCGRARDAITAGRHRLVWCHMDGLAVAWDAPDAFREGYIDPDDPPPPPGARVPCFTVSEDTDPDLVVGIRQVFAGQLTLLDRCLGQVLEAAVAAGWAVSDSAATTFAGRLYAELLAGVPFGLAVRAAREAAWVHNRSVNTWGAYQAYGDPSWSLGSGMPRVRPDFRTEAEALDAIDDAIFQARNTKELETALEQIARKMDPSLAQGAGRVDPSPAPPNAKVVAAAAAQTAKVYLALALAWPEGDEKRVSTLLQRAADRDSAAFHQVQRLLTGSARRTASS
jgi:hypothetical protein